MAELLVLVDHDNVAGDRVRTMFRPTCAVGSGDVTGSWVWLDDPKCSITNSGNHVCCLPLDHDGVSHRCLCGAGHELVLDWR